MAKEDEDHGFLAFPGSGHGKNVWTRLWLELLWVLEPFARAISPRFWEIVCILVPFGVHSLWSRDHLDLALAWPIVFIPCSSSISRLPIDLPFGWLVQHLQISNPLEMIRGLVLSVGFLFSLSGRWGFPLLPFCGCFG